MNAYERNVVDAVRELTVTPGHPVMSGAGYNCACGECEARWNVPK
jgi:hypothetical protein